MKKYLFIFLFPLLAFAGGHQQQNSCDIPMPPPVVIPPVIVPPVISPVIVVPPPQTTPTVPPSVSVSPVVHSSSGNGEIACSSPTSYGWDTNYPDGNCNKNKCTQISNFKVTNRIKGDGLAELYWSGGDNSITVHQNNHSFMIKNTGFYQVRVETKNDWFLLFNSCSITAKIDP